MLTSLNCLVCTVFAQWGPANFLHNWPLYKSHLKIVWKSNGLQFQVHLKPNWQLRHLNADIAHIKTCFKDIPSEVCKRPLVSKLKIIMKRTRTCCWTTSAHNTFKLCNSSVSSLKQFQNRFNNCNAAKKPKHLNNQWTTATTNETEREQSASVLGVPISG